MRINTLRLELVQKPTSEAHWSISSVGTPLYMYNSTKKKEVRKRKDQGEERLKKKSDRKNKQHILWVQFHTSDVQFLHLPLWPSSKNWTSEVWNWTHRMCCLFFLFQSLLSLDPSVSLPPFSYLRLCLHGKVSGENGHLCYIFAPVFMVFTQ